MYLLRAFLDPRSRQVRIDARDPDSLHKTVMRAFPDDAGPNPRKSHQVLHRLEQDRERTVLLVQSRVPPATEKWPRGYLLEPSDDLDLAMSALGENPAVRPLPIDRIGDGDRFAFRLKANTTRKIDTKTGSDGNKRNGRRVPVRGDEERLAWLQRHAERGGFSVDPGRLRITEVGPAGGRGKESVVVAGTLFEGILRVERAADFHTALAGGIGPAKAFGFGLLSLARVRTD